MGKFNRQSGEFSVGLAGIMLGFGVVYFICYFVLGWIYDTKEERKNYKGKNIQEIRVISKEEVMKRGVGLHTFVCSGIFFRSCKGKNLYQNSVEG